MNLHEKVVLITGASDGIGRETAIRLAKEGVKLALVARNQEKLAEVNKACLASGAAKALYYTCDITDTKALETTIKQINADFNGINVLLNIAGVWQKLNFIENISVEEVDRVIAINLTALIHTTRLAMPYLKEAEEAAVINFVSRSGTDAMPGQSIYCASKWGVRGFTEVLKEDLKDTKVRAAGIYPKGIKTKILEKAGDSINMDEFTEPADIAETIAFMLTRPPKLWLHEVRISY